MITPNLVKIPDHCGAENLSLIHFSEKIFNASSNIELKYQKNFFFAII